MRFDAHPGHLGSCRRKLSAPTTWQVKRMISFPGHLLILFPGEPIMGRLFPSTFPRRGEI